MNRPEPSLWNEVEAARRLPWLLVFRAAIGTVLLLVTIIVDLADWRMERVSATLYAVSAGIYFLVVVLGLLLRNGVQPLVLGSVHLAAAIFTAYLVVGATGGVESGLAYLYFLAILDGAIIGGRRVALAVATGCALVYGGQIVAQFYGYTGGSVAPDDSIYANAVVSHLAGFYLIALLAGYLGELLRTARAETGAAQTDRDLAERLHEQILQALPLGVLTIDAERYVRTANDAAARILGRSLEELVGERVPLGLAADLGGPASKEVSYHIRGDDKRLGVTFARTDAPGGSLGLLVIEDRTEMRALEHDLQTKERLASLGQMAAGIAHEIRNPLAAISGAVELMRGSDDATSRSTLEDIVAREIERLNAMIVDFLGYARPMRPERGQIDMVALAREVCALITQDPRWSTRILDVVASGRAIADVDAGQMRQVLWNLLRNAVEASSAESTVQLCVGVIDGMVELAVLDEGPGIAPEVLKHLFEPFRTTKADGTGLGLAMVHRIIDAHQGTIDIVNRDARGAVATVRLPLGAVSAPPEHLSR